jgi:hypothetical protein
MTNSKAKLSGFRVVCEICDRLGIVFDCPEDAPSSTQINCRHCSAPRGTLGELRKLSNSAAPRDWNPVTEPSGTG